MSFKGFVGCNRRISKEEQQFYELKNKAAEYYRANAVPQKIEGVLNQMFSDKPDDIYGYLANYFTTFSAPPVISRVFGKDIYDGKGQLSVQAEVFCVIRNEEKKTCSAVISSHCESLEDSPQNPSGVVAVGNTRRDSVTTAVRWINDPLSVMLRGCDPCDQGGVDKILSDFFMARYLEEQDLRGQEEVQAPSQPPPEPAPPSAPPKDKKPGDRGKKGGGGGGENAVPPPEPRERALPGGEAVGAVSLGVAKTGALLRGVPLYRHISALRNRQEVAELHIPVPLVTLLSCGKTSPGKLNLLEEVILIPKAGQRVKQVLTTALELQGEMRNIMNASSKTGPVLVCLSESGALAAGYERPEQALDLLTEACSNLGLALGTDLHLALNCAAHELMDYSKGKYDVMTGSPKTPDELVDLYEVLISKYPAVTTLIDPLRREDREQWQRLSAVIGPSRALLSDAASSRPPNHSAREDAPPLPGVRGHVLKQTNEMTVSDLIRISAEHKGAVVVGTTCGEPCSDDSLSDVAVGVGAAYIKLGGLNGGERLTKYNRLIAIEEELLQQGLLDSRRAHPPPLFNEPPEQSPQ